jgi:glycosyltransferase involved in cell wall biosynthesis
LANEDKDFEIIVADNAPDDNSTAIAVAAFPGVKYVLEKRKGLDIARNTGARSASNDIVAYIDDDVCVPANWIHVLKSCFDDPLTMAVTGLVIPSELTTEAQFIFERDWSFNKGYVPRVFNHRFFLDNLKNGVPAWDVGAGANMAFRRQVFQLAGWFDERLDAGASGCSGDSEMWYRIMAEGWNCFYFPQLYAFHQHRNTMKELRHQLFSYMRGHVSALLVQHENYGHTGNLLRLYKGFPRYYYYKTKEYLLNASQRKNSLLTTQIKGCLSGWKYYKANKHRRRQDIYAFPETLFGPSGPTTETLVSVIIPCFNSSTFLRKAINSVLEQTYSNVEVIVVDDGSTDETPQVCKEYEKLVKYVRVERVGVSAARNIGVQFSSGDFLVFLDADDFLYAEAIEINLYFFNYYPDVVFVSGGHVRIDEKGNYLAEKANQVRYKNNYTSLLQGNYIAMEATVMYRRELFFHFHFDTSLTFCEDYDLNLRIARYLPVFGHEKIIAAYRIHSGNTSRNIAAMRKAALRVLKNQEKTLINDEERNAYQLGLDNWKSYYS